MSEFDMLAFNQPRPVEQEPRAVEHMLILIKSKIPVSIDMVSEDVTQMSFIRTVEKGLSVGITVYNEDEEGLAGAIQCMS